MDLIRIRELARRSGVSLPTLEFYLREGLITPARKTGRTMAWYRPDTVASTLKERQFLPLARRAAPPQAAAPDPTTPDRGRDP